MMYLKNENNLEPLFQVLRAIGIEETVLDIGRQYLNTEQPRNNALLDKIKPRLVKGISRSHTEELNKWVKRNLLHGKNEELAERYVLYIHAVAGSSCDHLGLYACVDVQEQRGTILRILRSRYGERAEAAVYAIDIARLCNHSWGWLHTLTPTPEVCMEAMAFSQEGTADLLLCTYALSGMPLPEKKKGMAALFSKEKTDPRAVKLTDRILGYWNMRSSFSANSHAFLLLLIATAAGASYSESLAGLLQNNAQGYAAAMAEKILFMPISAEHLLDVIESTPGAVTKDYILYIASAHNSRILQNREKPPLDVDARLKKLAGEFTDDYRQAMQKCENPGVALHMEQLLLSVDSNQARDGMDLKVLTQKRCAEIISADYPIQKAEICNYLMGETGMDSLLAIRSRLPQPVNTWSGKSCNYIAAYGMDAFAERCICFHAAVNSSYEYAMRRVPGFGVKGQEAAFLRALMHQQMPCDLILNACGQAVAGCYDYNNARSDMSGKMVSILKEQAAEIASCEVKKLPAEARVLYLRILARADAQTYRMQLLALADDASKAVREQLQKVLALQTDWKEDITALLFGKKVAKRELALQVIAAQGADNYHDALVQALEMEKSASLKKQIGTLLGMEMEAAAPQQNTGSDLVRELTKGNKAKKLVWLFDSGFTPVHTSDGSEAETQYLQALLLCYANMAVPGINADGGMLAASLQPADLERFALEVLGKWLDQGASAKQKWVLSFSAVHGGTEVLDTLQHYIRIWPEQARGAIAAEAVRALALNGSSRALMAVDSISRKCRNKMVRSAASEALSSAARALGITTEELADRIVPDLGFDERMCRVFDYGTRQFRVYLTPALELEIYEGESKRRTLPKPGVKDEPEKAEAAVSAFKDMKKQMKTVIASQKQRLEYVLMCDRKWSTEGWKRLFVANPVMHSFAIGLIWGLYEDGRLQESFRYMEDGSFTTAQEEELELPEQAQIGLVHPIELPPEQCAAWTEQLSDYEITQPFPQLGRPVYVVTKEEGKSTELRRFAGIEINSLTLLGRMQKYGWYKGAAMNAGFFEEFYRKDISGREITPDGKETLSGSGAVLKFSGADISDYYAEDVTVGTVQFFSVQDGRQPIPLQEVERRYFSEIVAQLTAALGTKDAPEASE